MRYLFVYTLTLFCLVLNQSLLHAHENPAIDLIQTELAAVDSIAQPEVWLKLLSKLGLEQQTNGDFHAAIGSFERMQILNKLPHLAAYNQQAQLHIANVKHRQGDYLASVEILEKLQNRLSIDSLDWQAQTLALIGTNYTYLGNYAKAYKAQTQALGLYERLEDAVHVIRTHYNIGNIFYYQEHLDLALEHFENTLELSTKMELGVGVFQAYGALASVHEAKKQYDEALCYNMLAITLAQEEDNINNIAWNLLSIGGLYLHKEDYKISLEYLRKAYNISKDLNDKPLEAYVLRTLADVYTNLKQYDLALNSLDNSFAIAASNNEITTICNLYDSYATVYYETGNFPLYKEYIDKFITLKDSLFNEKLVENLSDLRKDFEYQQLTKTNEISILKKDQEISNIQIWSAVGISLALGVILFLFVYLKHVKIVGEREKNQLLQKKNQEILHQNEILATSNRDLEKFAYIISHDLKEPLRNISGFTSLLQRKIKTYNDQEAVEFMDFITNSTKQMHELLTSLLQYSRISIQEKNIRSVETTKIVKQVALSMHHQFSESKAQLQINDLPDVKMDGTLLYQVFLNFFSNALKFRNEVTPPIIEVNCKENHEAYIFSIADNGIGIEEMYFHKIFEVFQRLYERGRYSGSGIGLATCKKIVEERGGKIWVESKIGEGSTFYFSIPHSLPESNKGLKTTSTPMNTSTPTVAISNITS